MRKYQRIFAILMLVVFIATNIFTGLTPVMAADTDDFHYTLGIRDSEGMSNQWLVIYDNYNNGKEYTSYCVDPNTAYHVGSVAGNYNEEPTVLNDAQKNVVRWILNNSYPVLSAAEINAKYGLSGIDAVTDKGAYEATQSAIWYAITNPVLITPAPTLPRTDTCPEYCVELYKKFKEYIDAGAGLTEEDLLAFTNRTTTVNVIKTSSIIRFNASIQAVVEGAFTFTATGYYSTPSDLYNISAVETNVGVYADEACTTPLSQVKNGDTLYISRPYGYNGSTTINITAANTFTYKYLSTVKFLESVSGRKNGQSLVIAEGSTGSDLFTVTLPYVPAADAGQEGALYISKLYSSDTLDAAKKTNEKFTLWELNAAGTKWNYLGYSVVNGTISVASENFTDGTNIIKTVKDKTYMIIEMSLENTDTGNTFVHDSASFASAGSPNNSITGTGTFYIDKADVSDATVEIDKNKTESATYRKETYTAYVFKYTAEGTSVTVTSTNTRVNKNPEITLVLNKTNSSGATFNPFASALSTKATFQLYAKDSSITPVNLVSAMTVPNTMAYAAATGNTFVLKSITRTELAAIRVAIAAGKLYIKETTVPTGFDTPAIAEYQITACTPSAADTAAGYDNNYSLTFNTSNTFPNTDSKTLTIDPVKKVKAGTSTALTGAQFKIIKKVAEVSTDLTGNFDPFMAALTITFPNGTSTNSTLTTPGKVLSTWEASSDTIEYYLVETVVPTGYIKSADTKLTVTVADGNVTVKQAAPVNVAGTITVPNTPIEKITLNINKKNGADFVGGAEFDLYAPAVPTDIKIAHITIPTTPAASIGKYTASIYLDKDVYATGGYTMPAGWTKALLEAWNTNWNQAASWNSIVGFYLIETKTPDNTDYKLDSTTKHTVSFTTNTATVDVQNEKLDRVAISLTKVESKYKNPIKGATFELRYLDAGTPAIDNGTLLATIDMSAAASGTLAMTAANAIKFTSAATLTGTVSGTVITINDKDFASWNKTTGTYFLVETTAPTGYDALTAPVALVKAFDNTTGTASFTTTGNAKIENTLTPETGKGILVINKKSTSGTLLGGAEFTLYKYDDTKLNNCGAVAINNITIPPSGSYTSGWIPEGKYVLKETLSPSGLAISIPDADTTGGQYLLPENPYTTIEILPQNTEHVQEVFYYVYDVVNKTVAETFGSVTIYKKDFNNEKLTGAKFTIKDAAGTAVVIAEFELDDQAAKTVYLPYGTYTAEETTKPAGYDYYPGEAAKSQAFTLSQEAGHKNISVAFINTNNGSFKLAKHERKYTSTNLAGATFTIYRAQMNGAVPAATQPTYTEIKTKPGYDAQYSPVDNANGYVYTFVTTAAAQTITLPLGWYAVYEAKSPEGYKAEDNAALIHIKNNTEIITYDFYNDKDGQIEPKGHFIIKKVDQLGKTLPGATFMVYTDENCTANIGGVITIGENGVSGSIEVPIGSYWVKEVTPPFGYKLSETVVKINVFNPDTPAELNICTVTNEKLPHGYLRIFKIDSTTYNNEFPTGLSGAEFKIYKDEELKDYIKTVKVDSKGIYEGELPYGTYFVQESVAPAGYKLNGTVYKITISEGNALIENAYFLKVANELTPPPIPPSTPTPTTPTPTTPTPTTPTPTTPTPTTPTPTTPTPTTPTPTTISDSSSGEPTTTSTSTTTTTSEPTTATTTTTTSEPTTTTTTTTTTTAEPTTLPEILQNLIPLDGGLFAEDLGDGLYEIFDGNGVPLGYVRVPDGVAIEDYEVLENLIPLGDLNPKTGDNNMLLFLGSLMIIAIASGAIIIKNRKTQK